MNQLVDGGDIDAALGAAIGNPMPWTTKLAGVVKLLA